MKISEQNLFRQTLENFYLQATKNHSIKYALKNKLKVLFNNIRKQWLLSPETDFSSSISKTQTGQDHSINQFSSLSLTQPNQDHRNLSVSRSRSKLSKSKDSSRDMSENESKHFNCQWIYQSGESSHVLLFAIMSGLIATDNKFSFKYFQDKINDELSQATYFSELELSIIGSYWQKMGGLLARSKTIRWQKMLKEAIDKFPAKFTQLACRIILQLDPKVDVFSSDSIDKMSKQLKIQSIFFTLCYRDIEHITRFGRQGPELFLGSLSHNKVYVISNRAPEYSQDELNLRSVRNTFNVVTTSLLKELSTTNFFEYKELAQAKTDKEAIARDHFKSRLVELQGV